LGFIEKSGKKGGLGEAEIVHDDQSSSRTEIRNYKKIVKGRDRKRHRGGDPQKKVRQKQTVGREKKGAWGDPRTKSRGRETGKVRKNIHAFGRRDNNTLER